MRKNRDNFANFNRDFNIFQTVFWIMFALVAIGIIGMMVFQVFIGVKIVQDPNAAAQTAGNLLKTFLDSAGVK